MWPHTDKEGLPLSWQNWTDHTKYMEVVLMTLIPLLAISILFLKRNNRLQKQLFLSSTTKT